MAKAGRTLGYNLRTSLFSHLQRLSLAFHVRRSTGDVLTRITGDVQALEEFVAESVSDLVGSVMLLAGTLRVPVLAVLADRAAGGDHRAAAGHRVPGTSPAGSRPPPRSSVPVRGTWPPRPRRCSPRSAWSRSTAGPATSSASSRPRTTRPWTRSLRTARLEAVFGFTVEHPRGRSVIAVVVLIGARLVDASVDQGRHAGVLHPADPGHVQAHPADHQGVEHRRQDLRERRADRRAARP